MTMTDPIADMLVRIKNAGMAGHASLSIPYSKLKHEIAKKMLEEKLIAGVEKETQKKHPALTIELLYTADKKPKIHDLARISKPGRRQYAGAGDIASLSKKHSTLFLSTPKGVITGREARKENIGGELLLEAS